MIKSLQHLQNEMLNFLTGSKPSTIDQHVVLPKRLSAYKDSYTTRLYETLKNNYSQSFFYLGSKHFKKLGLFHILNHPSQDYNLQNYGYNLSLSLPCLKKDLHANDFIHAELLLKMDWLSNICFHSQHQNCAIQEKLLTISSIDNIKIQFQNHVQVMYSRLSIYDLWMDLLQKKSPAINKNIASNPEYLLFYRYMNQVMLKKITPLEYTMMHSLQQGNHLSQALQSIQEESLEPNDITKLFSTWISLDIIANIQ